MEELINDISKNKNFYGTDIEMKDFMEAIPFIEFKCIEDYVKSHTESFFKKDKGDILGYYVCKGTELFKFYLISVSDSLYMALEALPPCFWYEIKTYDDFRNVRKSYNRKGNTFQKRLTKISTKLSGNAVLGDIMNTIRSDYEYTMLIYNMCMENPFVGGNIFGTDELYDDYINKNKYNSLEQALLTKFIIDKEHGFCIRTVHTNSIISIKCVNNILFFSFYYNECPKSVNNINDLPLDLYLFMINFNMIDISDALESKSPNIVLTLHSSLPIDYYGEMRYSIYSYLVENESENNEDNEYIKLLKSLFTDYTVHKITGEIEEELVKMENKTDDKIRAFIVSKFTDEEKKFILDQRLNSMNFVNNTTDGRDNTSDTISEEATFSDIENELENTKSNNGKQVDIQLDTREKMKHSTKVIKKKHDKKSNKKK